jgi:hypothetical protein
VDFFKSFITTVSSCLYAASSVEELKMSAGIRDQFMFPFLVGKTIIKRNKYLHIKACNSARL